ncbi:MAG: retropepsin-like aspartic protease [Sphingomonas sp.]
MPGASARRLTVLLALPLLIAASDASLPPLPDPYAAPPRGTVATLLRRSQFGEPGADPAIRGWLAANPRALQADRAQLWHRLCSDDGLFGRYAAAVEACTNEAAVAPKGEADDDVAMASLLKGLPPVRAIGSAKVPLIANKLGSRSASITVNGFALPWFVDSGAEVSVVSQSVADRIKVRMLTGNVKVGTTTAPVLGKMGVVDRLTIGDATVENLPVFVLPDAQLTIADLPTIPAILGLPALVAFHRVAWLDGAQELALGDAAPEVPANAPRLYWHEEGVGVPISTVRGTRGAHLDSGANASYLRAGGHALLTRRLERSASTHERRIGGAGGVVRSRQKVLPKFTVRLARAPVTLTDVSIVEQDKEGAARIGDDAIAQLGALTLDFDAMRVAATPAAS